MFLQRYYLYEVIKIPKPKKDEDRDSFMKRCILEVIAEGKLPNEALGRCNGLWEQSKK